MTRQQRRAAARSMQKLGTPDRQSINALRSAKPRLLANIEGDDPLKMSCSAYISNVDLGWDEVLEEGFDAYGRLGATYFRIVMRDGKKFYLSTFMVSRDLVLSRWGEAGLAYCDPITGLAAARIDQQLPPEEIMKVRCDELKKAATDNERAAAILEGAARRGRLREFEPGLKN
jgi:hypothetical protein